MSLICADCEREIGSHLDCRVSDEKITCIPCGEMTLEKAHTLMEARFGGVAVELRYHGAFHVAARVFDENPPRCFMGDTPAGLLRDAGIM